MMSAPNPREIQEFQFRLLCRLRIFSEAAPLPRSDTLNLVTCASKYGLVFISSIAELIVIEVQKIVDLHAHEKKKASEILDYPSRNVLIGGHPICMDVNLDNQYLAIYFLQQNNPVIDIFEVTSFFSEEEELVVEIRLPCHLISLSWNPGNSAMLAACLIDGSVSVYQVKDGNININSIPKEAKATCLCWSPKGKQIVVGSANGTLCQFKPDLKIVKSIPAPASENPLSVVSVQWLSNFQFAVIYKDMTNKEKPVTALYIVNTPKGGEVTYINYEDICFSTSNIRPPQYYFIHQQNWNVLLVASGCSMELGVLGYQNDTWEHWIQEDQYRAELPLSAEERNDTLPVGLALYTSAQYSLPLSENQSLPPMPLLFILSDEGLLSIFFVVNLLPSAANICSPRESVADVSGQHHFVNLQTVLVKPQEVVKPLAATETTSWMPTLTPSNGFPQVIDTNSVLTLSEKQVLIQDDEDWYSNNQASCLPNWISAANPSLTLPAPSNQSSSVNEFPTPISTPTSSTAPSSLFGMGSKSSQSFTLPGTQVTITPAPISAGIKKPTAPTSTPSAPIHSIPSSTPQFVPVSKSVVNIPPVEARRTESPQLTPHYTDISPVKTGDFSADTKDVVSAKNDELILAAINEEIAILDSELNEFKRQHNAVNITVGSEDEKENIEMQIHCIESFFKDLKETTTAQKNEVNSLKNSLLETFNWAEDAKSKEEQYRNPYFNKLVKSRELDPVSARRMADIEHLIYYIESQITQVDRHLDDMWCDIKNKGPKPTLQTPSLDTVYQALVIQNGILHQQRTIIDEIEQRLDQRQRRKSNRLPLISDVSLGGTKDSDSYELSHLAENFLKIRLDKSVMENPNEMKGHARFSEALSEDKLKLIHDAFSDRPLTRIMPSQQSTKGTDASSIFSLISSLPASGVKPGGISSGQPIVTSSTAKESMTVNLVHKKANEKPFKGPGTMVPKADLSTQAAAQVLLEVKNNLIPSPNLEVSVKSTPMPGQQILQTNLFGNKENKPKAASTSSMFPTQQQTSFSEPQTNFFSFTSGDKSLNKEISFGTVSKLENPVQIESSKPTSSTSPWSSKCIPSQETPFSSAESPIQAKSPFSIMVSDFVEASSKVTPEKSISTTVPNKTIQSNVSRLSTTQSPITSATDAVITTNLFGGNTILQTPLLVGESATSKPNFKGNSTPTKSIFGGEPISKNLFGGSTISQTPLLVGESVPPKLTPTKPKGDSTPIKSIFGVDPALSRNVPDLDSAANKTFAGNTTPVKTIFGTPSVNKMPSESDSTNSKSSLASPSLSGKDASSTQSIFSNNLNVNKSSSNLETNVTKPITTAELSSASNSFPSDVLKSNTTSNQNVPSASKSSPAQSTTGLQKTLFGSGVASSTQAIFGAEPTIIQTETNVTSGKEKSSATVTKENSSQEVSSSSLFGNLNLGSALPTSQTKSVANLFGGNSSTFGSSESNIETVTTEVSSLSKPTEVSTNVVAFGSSAPTTTLSSSFNFGVAGASLFGNQTKPESTPVITSSPTKTAENSPSFGQLTVPATEAPLASSTTTNAAFSFTLPQSTTAVTSSFSFAQVTSSIPSTAVDDKNTKINLTFGQPNTTSSNSVFGGFNTQPATTSNPTSIFGSPPASTTSQTPFTFALPTTTTAQTSYFGNKPSLFGSSPATTTSSFFGSPATTSSVFGQPAVTTPVFGQASTQSPASSPFSSGSGFGAKPTFGQSGGSLFGQSPSGGFGSSGSTSMFGGSSGFGSAPTSAGPFQTPGTGSIFGGGSTSPGGSFSSGGQSVSQTGFGSLPAFQNKLGGFGAAPAFGAVSSPAFGSAPTFGGAPAFGSPSKVFGSSPPSVGFGSSTQQPTAFESLANQNTMSFGNLAQNQPGGFGSGSVFGGATQPPPQQQQQQQPGFSSPGSSFSGTSFSSWR